MDQETLIKRLKEDIAQGRVVIIVGTGVSVMACGNQEVRIKRSQRQAAFDPMKRRRQRPPYSGVA